MKLYEAVNGYIGESFLRCYVWAESQKEAHMLATARFAEAARMGWGDGSAVLLTELFDSSEGSFASKVSDRGWVKW